MPRGPRVAFPGAIYHITARGNNGEDIFRDEVDRSTYLSLVADVKSLMSVRLFAYVLMTNHVHLVLQTTFPNIARTMHRLHGLYASRFNRRHHRTGHLYGSRYHGKLIVDDVQFLETTLYIHLNPVRAGIVRNPEYYRWSSYRYYIETESRNGLVDPTPVLQLLAADPAGGREAYSQLVLAELLPKLALPIISSFTN